MFGVGSLYRVGFVLAEGRGFPLGIGGWSAQEGMFGFGRRSSSAPSDDAGW